MKILALIFIFAAAATVLPVSAAQVPRTAAGASPAPIQATVDQFRADLGGSNNAVGGSFTTGRREINWDGVPDNFSAPNFLPVDFFNANSPRGVVFSSRTTFGDSSAFIVSADSNNPTTTPVRFANIDPSYSGIYTTFSVLRLFTARTSNSLVVNFFIPGTRVPATVNGFGVVFTDVDQNGPTYVKYYGTNGKLLGFQDAPDWFRLNSAGFQDLFFGQNGDDPTPGDYDKDGGGQFLVTTFGVNGDIPVAGSRP